MPIFLCAHLDTVPPEGPLEPVVEDGVVRNAGGTILGADNKAAVVAMLEAARRIVAEQRPHAGVELLFTPKEEVGLLGAEAFDHSRLEARLGFVYDQAAPIGEIVSARRTRRSLDVALPRPRRRTRGWRPEEGRSAIAAAARAIADLRLGRIDEETTANVGADQRRHRAQHRPRVVRPRGRGALARRGASSPTSCRRCSTRSPSRRASPSATLETEVERELPGLPVQATTTRVRLARDGARALRARAVLELTGGGADANVFNDARPPVPQPRKRDAEIHTAEEHIAVDDLEAMVDVTLALVGRRCRSALGAARVTAVSSAPTGSSGSRSTASPCVAYPG